jgi:hypothetical protein
MRIVKVDLRAAGVHFAVTPFGGSLETVRSITLDLLKHEHPQVTIMKESEIADLLIRDYGVYNAIKLDGRGIDQHGHGRPGHAYRRTGEQVVRQRERPTDRTGKGAGGPNPSTSRF